MYLENQGFITNAAHRPADQRVCAFVTLCPTAAGTLFCGFQTGPKKHDITSTTALCRSRDGGFNWEALRVPWNRTIGGVPGSLGGGELVEPVPGELHLFTTWFDRSEPDRPLFDPETEGILHSKQLRAVSTDEGETWSPWEEIPIAGLTGCSGTGPVLKWPDGTIAYPFESYKEYDDPSPGHHAAWMLVSGESGRTFGDPLLVARHPEDRVYYWDQRLCTLPGDGHRFLALFWTHDLAEKRDLTVHLRKASLEENDLGASPIFDTGIPGQIAAPARLDDGRLLAFVVDRGKPATMTLWQSSDGGRTWPREEALVVYTHDECAALTQTGENVDFAEYWADMGRWSFGHPAARVLPDGRVLLAYYAGTPQAMSVRWARVVA